MFDYWLCTIVLHNFDVYNTIFARKNSFKFFKRFSEFIFKIKKHIYFFWAIDNTINIFF